MQIRRVTHARSAVRASCRSTDQFSDRHQHCGAGATEGALAPRHGTAAICWSEPVSVFLQSP
jgi:hypothetical protein